MESLGAKSLPLVTSIERILSPFLFILIMDVFSHMLSYETYLGNIKGFKVGNSCLSIQSSFRSLDRDRDQPLIHYSLFWDEEWLRVSQSEYMGLNLAKDLLLDLTNDLNWVHGWPHI